MKECDKVCYKCYKKGYVKKNCFKFKNVFFICFEYCYVFFYNVKGVYVKFVGILIVGNKKKVIWVLKILVINI